MTRDMHPSERARTARQPATEDGGRPDQFAGVGPATPSPWPLVWFAALMIVGTLLTTGIVK